MKDRSDDPSHHEQTLLPRSYISLSVPEWFPLLFYFKKFRVCFLFLFFVCLFCVFVCMLCCFFLCFFFWWKGRDSFNGRRVCGSLQLYQRQEFIKKCVVCVVCYSGSKYGSSFLITRVYCGFRHTQKTHVSRPHPCPKITPHLFFIYILFSNFPPENGANNFLGTRSDILYRLIRKHVAHSCTGDMWSQII